ncbi:hypothetical protein GCM10010922_13640 [Microbacterium sorbitolivorans]|nr:hypothetical protein GCM10010922_13640 [Microbacterium sorbitolivorans]
MDPSGQVKVTWSKINAGMGASQGWARAEDRPRRPKEDGALNGEKRSGTTDQRECAEQRGISA